MLPKGRRGSPQALTGSLPGVRPPVDLRARAPRAAPAELTRHAISGMSGRDRITSRLEDCEAMTGGSGGLVRDSCLVGPGLAGTCAPGPGPDAKAA